MIGLWLLAGSLAGGAEEDRRESVLASSDLTAIVRLADEARWSANRLWGNSPDAARLHLRRAMAGFRRLWELGCRNVDVAHRMVDFHIHFEEYPEAIVWARRGLRLDPTNKRRSLLLAMSRSEVRTPETGELATVRTTSRAGTPFLPDLREVFVAYMTGCLLLARGWMKRSSLWLALGTLLVVASVIVDVRAGIDFADREREWATPTVVIRVPETVLRSGNGTLYPPSLNQSLPAGLETTLLLRRGDWLQVELPSGVVGWIRRSEGIFVNDETNVMNGPLGGRVESTR